MSETPGTTGARAGDGRPAVRHDQDGSPRPAAGRSEGGRRPGSGHPPARLRGWGGVASMAVACVLTAACTLVPLACDQDSGTDGGTSPAATGPAGGGTTTAQPADAASCHPERSLRPSSGGGPTIDRIKKNGHLTVGVDQSSYRWGYLDPNKPGDSDPEGFDIDLVHEIADQIIGKKHAPVVYRAIPTNQRLSAIENGTVDMVVRTMTINCDRAKDVAFSTAYFETGQQILTPEKTTITGYNPTLAGKKVCSAQGSTALDWLHKQSYGADITTQVPNQLDCLVRLQLGEVDAVVTDGALAASQRAQDPTVKLTGDPFTKEYYGVAMKKDADDLVRRVNHILDEYRKSGWQTSYDKWLSADLGPSQGPPAPEYRD